MLSALQKITAVYRLEPQRAARYAGEHALVFLFSFKYHSTCTTDHETRSHVLFAASDQFEGVDADGQNAVCVVGKWEYMEEPVSVK